MKITREELIAENKILRPHWTAEEFIATRILREINASGAKAYEHLVAVVLQLFPECETKTRWDVAKFLLARRIALNLVVSDPIVMGLGPSALEGARRNTSISMDSYIRESPYGNSSRDGLGPCFYIFRCADNSCMVGYVVWNRNLIGDITPRFTVHQGPDSASRIILQNLDTFLVETAFQGIGSELVL